MTDRTIVIAYLEAESKSWPAWCRTHGEAGTSGIVDQETGGGWRRTR
jgi:hypothetical protein